MSELLVIAAVVGLVVLWFRMLAIKELALKSAKRHCETMDVQFLDGSVLLNGIRITRGVSGSLALKQKFTFEFSVTGERRYQGEVVFVGKRQVSVNLEAHVFH